MSPPPLDCNYYSLITAEAVRFHFSLSDKAFVTALTHQTHPLPSIVTGGKAPTFHAPTVLWWLARHHGTGQWPPALEAPTFIDPQFYQLVEREEIQHRFLIPAKRLTDMIQSTTLGLPVVTLGTTGHKFHIPTVFDFLLRTFGHGQFPTIHHIHPAQTLKAS